ncbi:MAG: hypothetical protein WC248_07905 [Candidatus Methanomethylophilaceae archaeon]|jgi:hypothetical protein
MNIIGISTIIVNINGSIIIEPKGNSSLQSATRRVSRTKTLDGGVCITDSGYSYGDRTLDIRTNITKDIYDKIDNIFKNHALLYVSTNEGFFSAAIESLNYDSGEAILSVLVKERLDL